LRSWDAAAGTNSRIFIAFAREDAHDADRIKRIFEAKRYKVYTYINSPNDPPKFSAQFTAERFVEADHHLALFTKNTWTSKLVLYESINGELLRASNGRISMERAAKDLEFVQALENARGEAERARAAQARAEQASREAEQARRENADVRSARYKAEQLRRASEGDTEAITELGARGEEAKGEPR
jgi:hypothetical protein